MASVQDLGKCSASRCTSYGILYFECSLKWLETKCSDTPTISIDDWVCILTIKHFVFSVMVGLIVEMLFMLFSIYNAV